ncbi:ATP-binding protein [Aneurinibacillus aneurinilyticus]|uniref:ATP-binding protein n=1 Tax=Aneurinibacillus aneurinilyticus TaxID=1391 RepID=UPI002E239082|nr:ATP-binding protein [Aneurinibacillus aneurinilyticus]MED0673163.1 ATP-binding protein [Aneurinibacillus aneurinilyticus]
MKNIREFLKNENMTFPDGEALEAFKRQREEEDRAMVQRILQENKEARKAKYQRVFNENSLISPALLTATFENYEPGTFELREAKRITMDYAERFALDDPHNLLMMGDYGVGKSHLAVSITKRLAEKGFTSIFVSTPELLTKIRSTYNRDSNHSELELLELIKTVDCLVLDDIGAEYGTDWAVTKMFEVVDSRLGRHTIYTTNLGPEELAERLGPRNMSRMKQDTEILVMQGDDYRDTVLCRRERR